MSKKISQIVGSVAVLSLLLLVGAGCVKEEIPRFQGDGYSGTIENVRIEKATDKPNNNRDYWNEEDTMGDSVENIAEDDQQNTDVSGEEVTESEAEAVEEENSENIEKVTSKDSGITSTESDIPTESF